MDFIDPALAASITDEELRHEQEIQAQEAQEADAEYEDGFEFALDWQPGMPVPPLNSRAWEAGVAAGMERNDSETRAAWEQANRT